MNIAFQVKHLTLATCVAKHLPSSNRSTSTCCTTQMRSLIRAHGRTVAKHSKNFRHCRTMRESTVGRGLLSVRLVAKVSDRECPTWSTGGETIEPTRPDTTVQDPHWGAALHLHCLWQEVQVQGDPEDPQVQGHLGGGAAGGGAQSQAPGRGHSLHVCTSCGGDHSTQASA